MNKQTLKVLLVDDNPDYAFCLKSRIPDLPHDIIEDNSIEQIPWVSAQEYSEDYTFADRLDGIESYFELRWLQFHLDAFEFRNLSYAIKLKYGLKKLAEVGYVPDLVVFDYALSDSQAENSSIYLNYLRNKTINNFINPNSSLVKFLDERGKKNIILPREDGYVDNSPKLRPDANYDSYGLFCGSMIAEMFRYETPIAAIPATRKGQVRINTEVYPAFFEWFLNDTYRRVFQRQHRTKKDWDSILKDGLKIYREELKNMIGNGMVSVDFSNLISLLSGAFIKSSEGTIEQNVLRITTAYGTRSIPLEGLFIDKEVDIVTTIPSDMEVITNGRSIRKRDIEIWEFLQNIVSEITQLINIKLGLKEILYAKEIADTLWNEYISKFEDRVDLSEYTYRVGSLEAKEAEVLHKLNSDFCVKNGKIPQNREVSILNFKHQTTPDTIRLAILLLITHASVKLQRLSFQSQKKSIYRELDEQEIYYLLNPVVNIQRSNGITLPMHFENFTQIRVVLDSFSKRITEYLRDTIPKPERSTFFDFNSWIKPGEKIILNSFFSEEKHLLPSWLK